LSETSKPFFNLLKKNARVKWDDECQSAFEKIKALPLASTDFGPTSSQNSLDFILDNTRRVARSHASPEKTK